MNAPARGDVRWGRALLLASLVPPLLLAHALVLRRADGALIALLLVWWAIACAAIARRTARWPRLVGPMLALAALHLFALTPELALRLVDFRHESGVRFGYPSPAAFATYVPHPTRFWALPATRPGVNELGLPGPALPANDGRDPSVVRLAIYGDSVAARALGQIDYGTLAAGMLQRRRADDPRPVEIWTLALPGYATSQGRALVDETAMRLAPDVAFVHFGWNDHWRARGAVDADQAPMRDDTPARLARALLRRVRVAQASAWLLGRLRGGETAPQPGDPPRVPLIDYRRNLRAMSDALEAAGARVVLMTAPSAHARIGVPDYLIEFGFAASADEVLARHRQYNDAVRALVAEVNGDRANGVTGVNEAGDRRRPWVLLDVAARWRDAPDLAQRFTRDGIHLRPRGQAQIAAEVAAAAASLLDARAAADAGTSDSALSAEALSSALSTEEVAE
ncbi:MAG: GDSL-type esterase/lipase family protein [Acidobacteriota bacterium]